MINVDNHIQVAFTITEEERKCPLDEKSILDMSLAFAAGDLEDDQAKSSRIDLDDERWIIKPVYYNVICPPPELS